MKSALFCENIENSTISDLVKETLGNQYSEYSNGQFFSIPMTWFGMVHGVMTIVVSEGASNLSSAVKMLNMIGANFCQRLQQHIFLRANEDLMRMPFRLVSKFSVELDAVVSATMRSVGKPSFDIWNVISETNEGYKFEKYDKEQVRVSYPPRMKGWSYEVLKKNTWILITGFRAEDGDVSNKGLKVFERDLDLYTWNHRGNEVDGEVCNVTTALSREEFSSIGTILGLPVSTKSHSGGVLWIAINTEYNESRDLPSSFAIHYLQLWVDSLKDVLEIDEDDIAKVGKLA